MRNKIFIIGIILTALVSFNSCEDITTEGVTDITYFPILEVLGEPEVFVDLGSEYVDAGVYAELNGEDITGEVEVSSNVDINTGGVYSVTYEVMNSDGFSATGSRTVYVVDPTPSVITSGYHTIATGTQRYWYSSEAVVPFSGYEILILQTEPGVFYISDFMGGYYDQKVGYGSNYAMQGYFKLNADNSITAISSYVPGWGDSLDHLNEGAFDPATGQISYKLGYAGLMEYTIIIN